MNGKSLSPDIEKFKQLKQLFPEVFSENKIDWEKLKVALKTNTALQMKDAGVEFKTI